MTGIKMPTYTYKCNQCDLETDIVMKMSETEREMQIECSVCGEVTNQTKIITSTGGFALKGKGWFGNSKTTSGY